MRRVRRAEHALGTQDVCLARGRRQQEFILGLLVMVTNSVTVLAIAILMVIVLGIEIVIVVAI